MRPIEVEWIVTMLAASLHETTTDDRRTAVRPVLEREGTVRASDVAPQPVVVHDLTRDGCRIATAATFARDDVIGIGIGGVGITLARIAWANEGFYGCAFVEPLRPGRVTAAFEQSNLVAFPSASQGGWEATKTDEARRWSRPITAAIVLGGGLLCWSAIGAAVLALV